MVDYKQAINAAKAYAGTVLGGSGLLLEEVRSHPTRFKITLSIPDRRPDAVNPLVPRARLGREYKVFDVDKQTGEVVGMSIRQFT